MGDFEDEGGGQVLAFGETVAGAKVAFRLNSSGQIQSGSASPIVTNATDTGAISTVPAPRHLTRTKLSGQAVP